MTCTKVCHIVISLDVPRFKIINIYDACEWCTILIYDTFLINQGRILFLKIPLQKIFKYATIVVVLKEGKNIAVLETNKIARLRKVHTKKKNNVS